MTFSKEVSNSLCPLVTCRHWKGGVENLAFNFHINSMALLF